MPDATSTERSGNHSMRKAVSIADLFGRARRDIARRLPACRRPSYQAARRDPVLCRRRAPGPRATRGSPFADPQSYRLCTADSSSHNRQRSVAQETFHQSAYFSKVLPDINGLIDAHDLRILCTVWHQRHNRRVPDIEFPIRSICYRAHDFAQLSHLAGWPTHFWHSAWRRLAQRIFRLTASMRRVGARIPIDLERPGGQR
jgi:hypothetical protein